MLGYAAAAFGVSLASWLSYFRQIAQETVPRRPWMHIGLQVAALGLAVASVLRMSWGLSAVPVVLLASTAAIASGGFLWLLSQAPTPDQKIKLEVGNPLLPFTATDSEGNPFDSASLADQRVLFKFYRGAW